MLDPLSVTASRLRLATLRLLGTALGAGLALTALGACQARPDGSASATPPAEAVGPEIVGGPGSVSLHARAEVRLGAYAQDGRVDGLAASWPGTVDRALERLRLVTGLALPATTTPRVVLEPLGDEDVEVVVGGEVQDGLRVPVLHVNLEPIAAGRRREEIVVLRGLAGAVFEDTVQRHGPVPAWVVRAAQIVAAGDLDARLVDLAADPGGVRVDPEDPAAADATAAAAVLVLVEGGHPDALRRFFVFAAEGDDPDEMLARLLHDPLGQWAGAGRDRLQARLAAVDRAPWRLLAEARRALAETGRAGMESVLPAVLPAEISGEVAILRAQAAADEGDYASARRLLADLDAVQWARLEDPGRAAALRVRAERGPGGNAVLASRLEQEWRRDYPRRAAWLAVDGTPAGADGATPSLASVAERVRALLADHRGGAARRVLAEMGERAHAPELLEVQRAVEDAEGLPSEAAVAANRSRVAAWAARPDERTADDVRAGGSAAAVALAEAIAGVPPALRRDAVRLLIEAGGAGRAVELLAPTWRAAPARAEGDLDVLLSVATYPELKVWVDGVAADVAWPGGAEAVWRRLRYGLAPEWVRERADVFRDLRSDAYPVRRLAFDRVVGDGRATPDLVAEALRDPAPLMRRAGVEAAGTEGFPALVRVALEDEAWMVRQAACTAAARALRRDAVPLLLERLATDDSSPVRLAAASSLFDLGAVEAGVVDVLVALLADEDAALRDLVADRLLGLDSGPVVDALLRALDAEVARPDPRGPVLARLFLTLQRTTRRNVGYVPGMGTEEVRALLADVRRWASRGGR